MDIKPSKRIVLADVINVHSKWILLLLVVAHAQSPWVAAQVHVTADRALLLYLLKEALRGVPFV